MSSAATTTTHWIAVTKSGTKAHRNNSAGRGYAYCGVAVRATKALTGSTFAEMAAEVVAKGYQPCEKCYHL